MIQFTAAAQKKNSKTQVFKVYGTCLQCKNRIERALVENKVYRANWSIETKMLTVSYDSTKLSNLKIAHKLASVGHDTEAFQAQEDAYKSLPKCCYYERYVKPNANSPQVDSTLGRELPPIETHTITGIILEEDKKGKLLPLIHATVHCLHTNHTSSTDSVGVFQLSCRIPIQLVISYVGFKTDTISITSANDIKVIPKKRIHFDSERSGG